MLITDQWIGPDICLMMIIPHQRFIKAAFWRVVQMEESSRLPPMYMYIANAGGLLNCTEQTISVL